MKNLDEEPRWQLTMATAVYMPLTWAGHLRDWEERCVQGWKRDEGGVQMMSQLVGSHSQTAPCGDSNKPSRLL